MTLPKFSPAPPPSVTWGKETRVDTKAEARCVACGEAGETDIASGTCRACWRAGPWAAAWSSGWATTPPYEPKPLPAKPPQISEEERRKRLPPPPHTLLGSDEPDPPVPQGRLIKSTPLRKPLPAKDGG